MPRVTLYVTYNLKARMDEAGEAVNWSAVAQRAFIEAVAVHSIRKDTSDMTSVAERLRASKGRIEARDHQYGIESGSKWAKETAEYDELQRVAAVDEADAGSFIINDARLETLQRAIEPDQEMESRDWDSFWEDRFGRGQPTEAFARGFIEGASEVYNEVKDTL